MEIVPLKYYYSLEIHLLLILVIFTLVHTIILRGNESSVLIFAKVNAHALVVSLVLYLGLRPLSEYYFVDMATYHYGFMNYKMGAELSKEGDLAFNLFTYLCAKFLNVKGYFLACAMLYIIPLFVASKRFFPNYYFFVFLMLVSSFSFYGYAVNGMRNGIATSIFILAISFHDRTFVKALFLMLSLLIHQSMALPILAYIAAFSKWNIKWYYFAWLGSILVSLISGNFWTNLFSTLGFGDDRLGNYLSQQADSAKFSSTGFRIDFLIYSSIPIILSYYYIKKLDYSSAIYLKIIKTYLTCNLFWVLVIRANFSNRFAFLSWFLMALVIFYPLFDKTIMKSHFKNTGYIMLGYFLITVFLTLDQIYK